MAIKNEIVADSLVKFERNQFFLNSSCFFIFLYLCKIM